MSRGYMSVAEYNKNNKKKIVTYICTGISPDRSVKFKDQDGSNQ